MKILVQLNNPRWALISTGAIHHMPILNEIKAYTTFLPKMVAMNGVLSLTVETLNKKVPM